MVEKYRERFGSRDFMGRSASFFTGTGEVHILCSVRVVGRQSSRIVSATHQGHGRVHDDNARQDALCSSS